MTPAFFTKYIILIFKSLRIWAINITSEERAAADLEFITSVYIMSAHVFNPDFFSLLILLVSA